jgi:AraC-like DNA-binding protein
MANSYHIVQYFWSLCNMDVLSEILEVLQLRGTVYFRTAFSPPWSVEVPSHGRTARFHLAAEGQCHVRVGAGPDILLNTGDLIVIPNGASHVLSDAPGRPATNLDDVLQRVGYTGEGVFVYGGGAQGQGETKLICGHMNFAEGVDHPLLRALPSHLVVTAELRARASWLDELLRLITRQMFADSPGAKASVIRLTEALFIEVIRTCVDQDKNLRGIIEAMEDPRIGRALSAMHRGLGREWTLDGIAREVGMSRSRFAERFQSLLGCAPMSYLSDLRLQKAMALLSGTSEPVQRIATQVGYRSPAAFSRAFSSHYGRSPRAVRRAPE